jgi:hypothetical protein
MKGLLFFLLLLSSSLRAQEPIDKLVTPNYVQFAKQFDTFNRKLLGCPLEPDYITKDDCHPKQGVMDVKLWKELNERAQRIFNVQKKSGKAQSRRSK